MAIARLPDSDNGDILGFAGSLIGAALTVFVAFLAIDYQHDRKVRADRRLLQDLLDGITEAISVQRVGKPHQIIPPETLALVRIRQVQEAVKMTHDALQYLTPSDAKMIQAFGLIRSMQADDDQPIEAGSPSQLEVRLGLLKVKTALAREHLGRK